MLEITRFDEKIKLKQLQNTWRFTRHSSMFFKYIELFSYVIISNTNQVIYFCMFYSMFETAGLLTILYPFALFGYALIEETRPRKGFWTFVRIYTTIILFIKFCFNLGEFDAVAKSPWFVKIQGQYKLGLKKRQTTGQIILYILPEMIIIVFIMLNQIQLNLNGLYFVIEEDVETIDDGI